MNFPETELIADLIIDKFEEEDYIIFSKTQIMQNYSQMQYSIRWQVAEEVLDRLAVLPITTDEYVYANKLLLKRLQQEKKRHKTDFYDGAMLELEENILHKRARSETPVEIMSHLDTYMLYSKQAKEKINEMHLINESNKYSYLKIHVAPGDVWVNDAMEISIEKVVEDSRGGHTVIYHSYTKDQKAVKIRSFSMPLEELKKNFILKYIDFNYIHNLYIDDEHDHCECDNYFY